MPTALLARASRCFSPLLLAVCSLILCAPVGRAALLTTLHSFTNGGEGSSPTASLVQVPDGSFYGTTPGGGNNNAGSVYRITPAGALTTLYSFTAPNDNGINPDGSAPTAALAVGSDGSLYGTAQAGGTGGFGTVFKITTDGVFTPLYSFKTSDGNNPVSGLVQGGDGNFYGTTLNGGSNSFGTVYQITPAGALTTVHSFASGEGYAPSGALAAGTDGSFYGVTRYGGTNGVGTVFRVTPGGDFATLASFATSTGSNPTGVLVRGSDGSFYGVAPSGGSEGLGTVFKVTPGGVLSVLYSVRGADNTALASPGGIALGNDGNLYVTSLGGGTHGKGALFSLPTSGGSPTTLYIFSSAANGIFPQSALTQGADGRFYGTTAAGGAFADGTVFRLELVSHPPFFAGEVALSQGVYYLVFPGNGKIFGYYEYLSDPHFVYHFDLGFEYVFDAGDGHSGVYFYDFTSGDFFYTSPTFPFPYLYDFTLKTFLYYYPDPTNPQRYNTNNVRYFYNFSTGQTIMR